MGNAIEPGSLLVVGVHHVPWAQLGIGLGKHVVLGPRIVDPMLARCYIHGAKLPSLDRIAHAVLEAHFLLLVVDRKPVLYEDDARANQHLLKERARAHELPIFKLGAEAHDALNASAVVPATIEQDNLTRRWQFGDIALE